MNSRRASACVRGERGTVLIQVAVAMLALLGLCSFVFDYGIGRSGSQSAGSCWFTAFSNMAVIA